MIDAIFSLVADGQVPPDADAVAARAGVSVSSMYRIFDGLADMQRQALGTFHPRFATLFEVDDAAATSAVRVRAHVHARVELFESAGGLLRIGRSRSLDHLPIREGMAEIQARFAEQTLRRFATEMDRLTPAAAANLSSLLDAMTSAETYDVMRVIHARSRRQITSTWIMAVDTLLQQTTDATPTKPRGPAAMSGTRQR